MGTQKKRAAELGKVFDVVGLFFFLKSAGLHTLIRLQTHNPLALGGKKGKRGVPPCIAYFSFRIQPSLIMVVYWLLYHHIQHTYGVEAPGSICRSMWSI